MRILYVKLMTWCSIQKILQICTIFTHIEFSRILNLIDSLHCCCAWPIFFVTNYVKFFTFPKMHLCKWSDKYQLLRPAISCFSSFQNAIFQKYSCKIEPASFLWDRIFEKADFVEQVFFKNKVDIQIFFFKSVHCLAT